MLRRRYLEVVLLILLGIVLYSVAYQFLTPKEGEGRLEVQIDGQVFYDDEFNETYDYSQLWEKTVFFREKMNYSEYASGDVEESEELLFVDFEEVCQYLRELGVPNVVVGAARFMGNGTFEEVYMKIYDRLPGADVFGKTFGDSQNGVYYLLHRYRIAYKECGLEISKKYISQEVRHMIWSLKVGDSGSNQLDTPPFPSIFTRYPSR